MKGLYCFLYGKNCMAFKMMKKKVMTGAVELFNSFKPVGLVKLTLGCSLAAKLQQIAPSLSIKGHSM